MVCYLLDHPIKKMNKKEMKKQKMIKKIRYVLHLQLVLHELLLPEAVHEYRACEDYWRNATGYSTFMRAVTCVRQSLGSRRLWPGKIRFYRKFHSFVRDGWASYEKCVNDPWKKITVV